MSGREAIRFTAIVLLVVYAGLAIALPAEAFFSGYEGIAWLQTDSLRRHFWTSLRLAGPAADFDPEGEFLAVTPSTPGGSPALLSWMLPLAASVPYAFFGMRSLWIVPALAVLLCLFAAARLARLAIPATDDPSGRWAALAGAASVVATPLVFCGAAFWEYAPAAALVTAAMIPLTRACVQRTSSIGPATAVSGFLFAMAAWGREEALLVLPAVLAAATVALGGRAAAMAVPGLVTGAALLLVPRAWHHASTLGSWLPRFAAKESVWERASLIPMPSSWVPLIAVMIAGVALCAVPSPRVPLPSGARRVSPARRLLAWTAALYALLALALVRGADGSPWIPGLLLPAAPMGVIALVGAVVARRRLGAGRLAAVGLAAAIAAGVVAQGIGLRFMVSVKSYNASLMRTVERSVPEGSVVWSDVREVARLLMPLSADRPVFYARPGADLDPILARLEHEGIASYWITREGASPQHPWLGQRAAETGLPGSLKLWRLQDEPGIRGFAVMPRGD